VQFTLGNPREFGAKLPIFKSTSRIALLIFIALSSSDRTCVLGSFIVTNIFVIGLSSSLVSLSVEDFDDGNPC
jgi:hypothetical protein